MKRGNCTCFCAITPLLAYSASSSHFSYSSSNSSAIAAFSFASSWHLTELVKISSCIISPSISTSRSSRTVMRSSVFFSSFLRLRYRAWASFCSCQLSLDSLTEAMEEFPEVAEPAEVAEFPEAAPAVPGAGAAETVPA